MSCCKLYGDCAQSDTCPHRTGVLLRHQCAHAAQVARIKNNRPLWMDGFSSPVPPEAGNFQIVDLGPDDSDCQPMSHDESMRLVRTLLIWLAGVLATVVVVSLLVSYGTEAFADVLWLVLAGLS